MELTGRNIAHVMLRVDNESALDLMKNHVFHGWSKHIDTRYHFIGKRVENGDLVVKHIGTN